MGRLCIGVLVIACNGFHIAHLSFPRHSGLPPPSVRTKVLVVFVDLVPACFCFDYDDPSFLFYFW